MNAGVGADAVCEQALTRKGPLTVLLTDIRPIQVLTAKIKKSQHEDIWSPTTWYMYVYM